PFQRAADGRAGGRGPGEDHAGRSRQDTARRSADPAREGGLRHRRLRLQPVLGQHLGLPDVLLHRRHGPGGGRRGHHDAGHQAGRRGHRPADGRDGRPHPHPLGPVPALPAVRRTAAGLHRGADLDRAGLRARRQAGLGLCHLQPDDAGLHGAEHAVLGAERGEDRRQPAAHHPGELPLHLLSTLGAGDERLGWQLTLAAYGAVACLAFLAVFASTRERIQPPPQQRSSVRQDIGDLLGNRPWLVLFVLALVIMVTIVMRSGSLVYYLKYYVERPELIPRFLTWYSIGLAAGAALTPVLTRYVDKRAAMMWLMVLAGLVSCGMFFVPRVQVGTMVVLNTLVGV